MQTILLILKAWFTVFSRIAPALAARQAFNLFQQPRKRKLKPKEQEFYAGTEVQHPQHPQHPQHLESPSGSVTYYEQGQQHAEMVVLVHGWESNAGSMSGLAHRLHQQGYHTVLIDLPAHGKSPANKLNMATAAGQLTTLLSHLTDINPNKPLSMVTHSFGSLVTAFALSHNAIKLKRLKRLKHLVYLTIPRDMQGIFDDYSRMMGLNKKASARMEQMAVDLIKEPITNVTAIQKTKQINYGQLTLIHDRQDKMLAFEISLELHSQVQDSVLIPFESIGHYRMLWNEGVWEAVGRTLTVEVEQPVVSVM